MDAEATQGNKVFGSFINLSHKPDLEGDNKSNNPVKNKLTSMLSSCETRNDLASHNIHNRIQPTLLRKRQLGMLGRAKDSKLPTENTLNRSLIRKEMVAQIENLLQSAPDQDGLVATKNFAQALERHLYKTAPSFEAFADQSTLQSRLRLVTVALLRRKMRKAQRNERPAVLMRLMGPRNYKKAKDLVEEVRAMRLDRTSQSCPCSSTSPTCSLGGSSSIKAQETLPEPLRRLFFGTHLVSAFGTAPVDKLASLDWPALMQQASENILRYRHWESQQQTSSGIPSFSETHEASRSSDSDLDQKVTAV